jgi:branched-chain amino acid transport system permease protein
MDILPQILINGIVAGALYGLIALGLSLIYGVLGFMNFAHGEMAMLGAFIYYYFFIFLGWPILPSVIATVIGCGIAGLVFDKLIFERLRQENPWTLLVTSIGVSLFVKASMLLIATGKSRSYFREGYETQIYKFLDGRMVITNYQVFIILSTILILLGLALFLKYTKTGKAIRAVSDNPQAASILGINVKKTITQIFIISTAIAGFAGILIGYEQNLTPNMGFVLSIFAFAAVIVGGLGSIWGAVLGGFLIGLIQDLVVGLPWFGIEIPTSYKSAVAFVVLILMLLIRPGGLFGASAEEAARK